MCIIFFSVFIEATYCKPYNSNKKPTNNSSAHNNDIFIDFESIIKMTDGHGCLG